MSLRLAYRQPILRSKNKKSYIVINYKMYYLDRLKNKEINIFHPSYSREDSKIMKRHTASLYENGARLFISCEDLKIIKRHTPFSHKDVVLHQESCKYGSHWNLSIPRYSDLVSNITFIIDLLDTKDLVDDIELALIKNIMLMGGGSQLEEITNDSLYKHHHLNNKIAKRDGNKFIITIPFFTNNNKGIFGKCLPMVALQYHDIKLSIEFESLQNLTKHQKLVNENKEFNICVFAKYTYLSDAERKKFTLHSGLEYLITQNFTYKENICNKHHDDLHKLNNLRSTFDFETIEKIGKYITGNKVTLNEDNISTMMKIRADLGLHHPVKNINISIRFPANDIYFNYKKIIKQLELKLDGTTQTNEKGLYLNTMAQNKYKSKNNNIYSILLENNPNEFQPSGSINFSRVDRSPLSIEIDTKELEKDALLIITSENYNILRVMSGMLGLAYTP